MAAKHFLVAMVVLMACKPAQVDAGLGKLLGNPLIRDIVSEAIGVGVNGISDTLAGVLEEAGEPEAAGFVRNAGDFVDEHIGLAVDATACAGAVFGGGPVAGVTALFNPACKDAGLGLYNAVSGDGDDDASAASCPSGTISMTDAVSCVDYCESVHPDCFSWYMDHGCCLCKPYCDDVPGGSETYTPPSTDTTTSCSPNVQYDVDFWGADIVPVTTKWADTAVSAASPEDCCEACSLYNFCEAWTFAPGSNCKERFPNAPGCCFLKKGSGFEVRSAPGMISGTTNTPPVAQCTLEFDTDLMGGDLLTPDGYDTVVATISDVTCCNSCAATPGCGAWTMTPPSYCEDRLDGPAVGCCFLKTSSGWTSTRDDKGVMTSGVLLGRK